MQMYDNFNKYKDNFNTDNTPGQAPFSSVLDNIGTFRHFSRSTPTNQADKKDFYTLYYRRQNLRLVQKLQCCKLGSEETIKKVTKQMLCCSSHSEVKEFEGNEAHITKTSKKCKSRYCLICSRIESNKNTMKFFNKATSEEHADFFQDRRFYFLTLTLKHNADIRNDNYLKELRSYISKLTRSKLFRDTFIQSKDKNNFGAIQSIEMTMNADSYHIHSHILICCHPLKNEVSKIETDLKNLWLKITGDSHQVRLDLIKWNPAVIEETEIEVTNDKLISVVSEVFKYVVKSESLSKMKGDQVDKMAQWIIDTKGKNFINALGYFRKLNLIRREKKEIIEETNKITPPVTSAAITKTIHIEGNAKLHKPLSKQLRRDILNYFKIVAIVDIHHDVTDIQDQTGDIFKTHFGKEIDDTFLINEIAAIKRQNAEWEQYQNEDHFGWFFNKDAAKVMNKEEPTECPF
jgi:hypothetical protein